MGYSRSAQDPVRRLLSFLDSNVGASPTLMAVHGKYVGMAE